MSKKKDPVLWVVVDRIDQPWGYAWMERGNAAAYAGRCKQDNESYAPFRVVKYLPAPKPKKRKKAK